MPPYCFRKKSLRNLKRRTFFPVTFFPRIKENWDFFPFYIGDIFTDVYILHRWERIRFSIYYMKPTSKCLDVGDHIFAVVCTKDLGGCRLLYHQDLHRT